MTYEQGIEKLDALIASKWEAFLSRPQALHFGESLMGKDRRVYAMYLTQIYHYTYHTARNQALVAVNRDNTNIHYMQFCLEHALEETGHEWMAVHDLRHIGVSMEDPEKEMPPALPETELLVAYLYWVSTHGPVVQRLGYSYWAEKSYDLIGPFVEGMVGNMGLSKSQITFYYNHAQIDDKHAKDVENILAKVCTTEADWAAVMRTASTTIDLTHRMIEAVIREYHRLTSGEDDTFAIVNQLTEAQPA